MNFFDKKLFVTAFFVIATMPSGVQAVQCEIPVIEFSPGRIDDHLVVTSKNTEIPLWKKNWDQARILYGRKQYDQAMLKYQQVLSEKDNIDQARWEYINLLMCRKMWEKAAVELALLISRNGERPAYQLAEAEIALGQGEYGEALRRFKDLYSTLGVGNEENEISERILRGYISVLDHEGHVEALVPLLEKLCRLRPDNVELLKKFGLTALADNQPRRALTALNHALEVCGDDREIFEGIARCYTRLGRPDQAALFWQKSIAVEGGSQDAHRALSRYYHDAGNYPMELVHTRALLVADPDNPELLDRVARLNGLLGRPDRALEYYNRLLRIRPDDREAAHARHLALQEVASRLFALIENSGSTQLWPDLVHVTGDRNSVFSELAAMLRRRGMDRELIEVLSIMNREHPSDKAIQDELDHLLHKQNSQRRLALKRNPHTEDPVSITR
jgi:tetratricopeptide (TPR) repeat protein